MPSSGLQRSTSPVERDTNGPGIQKQCRPDEGLPNHHRHLRDPSREFTAGNPHIQRDIIGTKTELLKICGEVCDFQMVIPWTCHRLATGLLLSTQQRLSMGSE